MQTESGKQCLDIFKCLRLTPDAVGFGSGDINLDGVSIEITIRRGPRITPSSVGELVPVVRAGEVRLLSIGPKDRSDGFLSSGRGKGRSPGQRLDLFLSPLES